MKKFFKIIIISILLLALFFLPVIIAVMIGASALSGFLVSLSVLSLGLLFMLLRAFWQRWREKKFINGLLEQDAESTTVTDRQLSEELSKHWKEAMGDLKKSNLKTLGNPLYVLPWYMFIGEHGSGKTTALKNSGLTSKFASPPQAAGMSGTRNCDWWYFEQAIIIDTAGRYALHQDEVADRDEWRLFLAQLAKYRKKEPLNGLIISVSADKLLKFSPDEIQEEGKKIRIRIEELMQSLGAKFPVYVLVTKSDLIYGMKQFCDLLPETSHDQAFGYLNDDFSEEVVQIVDKAFNSLSEKAGNYRLRMANTPGDTKLPPEVILFPEEFATLKKGLAGFIEGAFNKSVYQEQPFLRGVYFTSARQSGEPHSHFINDIGLNIDKNKAVSDKSYFLYDFFAKILPSDRGLFVLTRRAREWKKKIKIMKMSAWAVSIFALCGFLSWSFGINLVTIKKFQQDFSNPPVLSGKLLTDINTLDKFKETILKIEKQNQQSWLPGFGLNHSKKIERDLKKTYCRFFKDDFILSYDKKMTEAVVNYTESTPLNLIGKTIPHYIKRINLLNASLTAKTISDMESLSLPDFKSLVLSEGQKAIPKSFELLESQYLHYLLWASNKSKAKEMERLKSRLDFIAVKEEISMQWMVAWCNSNPQVAPITLSDFWPGRNTPDKARVVAPAFTVKGSDQIEAMITELEQAMETPLNIEKKKIEFRQWYKDQYIDEWYNFGKAFGMGVQTLVDETEKLATAKRIAAGKGPYLSLLSKMAEELAPCLDTQKALPQWVELVYSFDEIKKYSAKAAAAGKSGMMGNIAKKGLKLFGKAGKIAGSTNAQASGDGDSDPEHLMISADSYNRYVKGLEGVSKASVSPMSSYALASTVFIEDPATGESPVFIAKRGLEDLKVSIQNRAAPQKMFTGLLNGPLDFVWKYVCKKTGCHIQQSWDTKVLSEVDGVFDAKVLSGLLFGKGGYVNKFTTTDIAPFVTRSRRKGFHAKTVAGERIPFSDSFFAYLTRGAFSVQSEKAEYKVVLKGMPTDTNSSAKLIPHVTKLELECAEGSQTLENYNFPVSHTFVWSPTGCGDVNLKINIGHLVLEKKYTGFRPFAKFLKDFSKGQHTFYRKEFRGKSAALKRMGIKYIKVKYKISGGRPVIRLLRMAAGNAPEVIVPCSG